MRAEEIGMYRYVREYKIDHFTVVCLVAWPLNESEAGVDLVFDRNLTAFHMQIPTN